MPEGSNHLPDIEAMLDRLAETGEVSDAMRADPGIRSAVELQNRIDASLRRSHDPDVNAMIERLRDAMIDAESTREPRTVPAIETGVGSSVAGRIGWAKRLAVAAVLVAGVFGGWVTWNELRPQAESIYRVGPWSDFGTTYHAYVDQGFDPQWVCETEAIFADTFKTHLGEAIVLRDVPADTAALGLAYCHSISRETIAVLVNVREQPVMLFIDRAESDDHPATWQTGEELHHFSRRVGTLVVHEITPFDEPLVMQTVRSLEATTAGS